MKITLSKSQWESVGKTAGWMKKAQVVPSRPGSDVLQFPNGAPPPMDPNAPDINGTPQQQQGNGQAPVNSKVMRMIEQNLKSIEMQANQLTTNRGQITQLLQQIRQLAQTDPGILG
jgi:hypothetical protein